MSRPTWLASMGTMLAFAACNAEPTAPAVNLSPFAADGSEIPDRAPGEFYTLDNVYANASGATDPNGDALTYEYVWSKDGDRQVDQNTELLRGVYTKKGETWTVDVHAWDGKIQGPKSSAQVTILNTPPVTEVDVDTPTPTTTDDIRALVTKSDVDGDPTTVRYVWLVNGSPQSISGDTLQDKRTTKGEVWELQAIANDGEVDGPPGSVTFTIGNTPPEFTKATISSLTPDKTSTLNCSGEGWVDEDEDPEGYLTEWFVNGVSYSTDVSLVTADLARGDKIQCSLTAFDGDDEGNSHTSDVATMQNTAPTIVEVTIGPPDPTKDDTVFPVIDGASDPDGDAVTFEYAWYISGSLQGTTEVLPPSRFGKDDVIRLEVTPFDGELRGVPVGSNTLRAANNKPIVDEVRLTPASPYTDDLVEAEVFTSDPDGDDVEVAFEWYVNATKVAATGSSLDGDIYFSKGDDIYVEVTPSDKEDFGEKVTSGTVTAINTIPSRPTLKLDPVKPDGTTDVLCDVTEASVDPDGDTLTYTFRWTVNGSVPSSLTTSTYTNDTLPSSAYTSSDVLICRVTVSDGTATSPEAVAGTLLGTKDRPGADCQAILDERGTDAKTGKYWVDPDDDGDISDAYEVLCDMESDGGGWTIVYYVDAQYFDGYYVNSTVRSSTPPKALNDQKDIWNIPTDIPHTETLLGCTTQNDASTHWWLWEDKNIYTHWNATSRRNRYESNTADVRSSSTSSAVCYTDYPGDSGGSYGFAAVEESRCGSCSGIVWGAYHYRSSTGCNSTSTSYGNHTSKWRTRSITYPVCNKSQTSNGKFWIAVR